MSARASDVLVIGAGAAGLWCAARLAEEGFAVRLLEKTERTGTKVLASGGTRCNLTTTLGPDDAARLFGTSGERFVRRALRALPPLAVRERFHDLGVPTVEAPLEKVFPASDRARDVRDALERWAREAGAELVLRAPVVDVRREGDTWVASTDDGGVERASRVVLACGGKSYPRTGTTGDGYEWLARLELPLVAPVPALAPLTSPDAWARALTGIALQDVDLRLLNRDGHVRGRRARPIVFTHHGLSGPGAMDLSEPVARGAEAPFTLVLDLLPAVPREDLRDVWIEAAGAAGAPSVTRVLRERVGVPLPKRLVAAVAGTLGAGRPDPPLNALTKSERHDWIEALKGLRVRVDGTLGFEKAEVTAGGLALRAVDPGGMAVRGRPGLFVIGELLDLQGPIGGLNFQAAFATAEACARGLARERGAAAWSAGGARTE